MTDAKPYALLADLVVAAHLAYVAFVVLGLVAIVVGALLRWRWVRNRWFRLVHFVAILFVAAEALLGIECPLTTWERDLRREARLEAQEGSFIGRFCHDVLFVDASERVLTICYVAFALLVLVMLVFVRPRWRA